MASFSLSVASNEANSKVIHHVLNSSISDELSGHTIIDILETLEGDVWISTDSGISRYRGQTLEQYYLASSSTHELYAVALYETESSYILAVGSDGSIFTYDLQLDKFIARSTALKTESNKIVVTSSLLSVEDTLFLGDSSGLISTVDTTNFNIIQREKFSDFAIADIIDTEGNLLLTLDSTGAIFSSFSGTEGKLKPEKHSECITKSHYFTSFDIFRDGSMLLGTSGDGMYLLDFESAQCSRFISNTPKGNSQERLTVHDLYYDNDILYASTDQGIFVIYDRYKIEIINELNTLLPSSEIRILRPSRSSDNLWIGTFSGLSILKKTNFEVFLADNYSQFSSVVDFGEIPNIGYAIGTYRNGVYVFVESETKTTPIKLNEALPRYHADEYSVMTILGKDDSFWIGYRNSGLERFSLEDHDNEIFSTRSSPDFSSNSISDILDMGKNRTLVGTYGGGIYLFEGKRLEKSFDTNSKHTNGLLDNRIIFLFLDSSGIIWVGTESGLQIFTYEDEEFLDVTVESEPVSYTHLTLPTNTNACISRWSPYH